MAELEQQGNIPSQLPPDLKGIATDAINNI